MVISWNQARNQWGRWGEKPPRKNFTPLEKSVGHSLKNLGTSQKTFRHPRCPKLVTGLLGTGLCFHPA